MAARSTSSSSSLWDTLSSWTNNIGSYVLRSQAQQLNTRQAIATQNAAAQDKANARATELALAKINASAGLATRTAPIFSGGGTLPTQTIVRSGFSLPSWAAPAGVLLVGIGLFAHFKKA